MTTGQLRALLWLRWRLSVNQWKRRGAFERVVGGVVTVVLLAAALGIILGSVFAGYYGLPRVPGEFTVLVWDGLLGAFLLLWGMGLMAELQRSEMLDLTRMLHFPVSPRGLFVLNYIVSHVALSVLAAVPALFGLGVGLAAAQGGRQLLVIPLGLAVLFMITAWTYCLRGWLSALMVNPRRRRSLIVGITAGFILLAQVPNLVLQSTGRHARAAQPQAQPQDSEQPATPRPRRQLTELPPVVWTVHAAVPVLWFPAGAHGLAAGNPWPALGGMAGALLIGGLGLGRAYRSTLRFYRAESRKPKVADKPAPAVAKAGSRPWNLRFPGMSEQVNGVATVTARTLLRAPEVRMALVGTLVMVAVFGFMILFRRDSRFPVGAHPWVVLGCVLLSQLSLGQLFCNQFGLDRDGFRAYVLSPVARRQILLGKNLVYGLMAGACALVPLVVLRCLVAVEPGLMLAGLLQAGIVIVVLCLAGNLASILAPYRMVTGTLKKARTPLRVTLLIIALQLVLPLLLSPAALPTLAQVFQPWSGEGATSWMALLTAGVLLALTLGLYRLCLPALEELLTQRQLRILDEVTRETE